MNCTEAQELLSAYHDGELPEEVRVDVDAHVHECNACAGEVESFRKLSAMAGELTDPQTPESVWEGIESQLADTRPQTAGARPKKKLRVAAILGALAASLLAATFVGYQLWGPHHGGQHMAAKLDQYVDLFHRNPKEAQNLLMAAYPAAAVDLVEASDKLGYRPAVAAGLPAGYSIDATYVVQMPCCTCLQTICRRDNGDVIAIFEHDVAQEMWFGDRPKTATTCRGKACSLIDVDGQLVATWEVGQRHLTFIGVEDVAELEVLSASLDKG
jgi:predicted anti-sigma-YlaC factor YlaD